MSSCWDEYLTEETEGGMGLLRFTVLGHSVRLGREGTAGEDSDWQAHHNHSEETETGKCWYSVHFYLGSPGPEPVE